MTEAVQSTLVALINNSPAIIAAAAAAWVVIWRSNKKTVDTASETNALVATAAVETSNKLNVVHDTVNGNLAALTAKYEAERAECQLLRESNAELRRHLSQLSRKSRKRVTD